MCDTQLGHRNSNIFMLVDKTPLPQRVPHTWPLSSISFPSLSTIHYQKGWCRRGIRRNFHTHSDYFVGISSICFSLCFLACLAWNAQKSSCLGLPSVGLIGAKYHACLAKHFKYNFFL